MAIKTFIPALLFILNRLCRYGQRYNEQLSARLTPPQKQLLENALAACVALTNSIGALPRGD